MYRGKSVAVVVPAHNEEKLIARTITTVPEFVDHIVVIDDKSTDETAKRALGTGDARLHLVEHEVNTGVGGAIIDGHKLALELDSDINVVMAGDAQMDP